MADVLLYRLHTPAGEVRAISFALLRAAIEVLDGHRATPVDLLAAVTIPFVDTPRAGQVNAGAA